MGDMAWMMGHKEAAKAPEFDVLFFLRTDHEGEQIIDHVHELVKQVRPTLKCIFSIIRFFFSCIHFVRS